MARAEIIFNFLLIKICFGCIFDSGFPTSEI